MGFRLITPPGSAAEDLLDRLRAHIRVDGEDELLTAILDAVVRQLDGAMGELGRTVLQQTWAWDLPAFPDEALQLPLPPCQADAGWTVTSVSYVDEDGASQTLVANTDYLAPAGRGYLQLAANASWPATAERPDAVTITIQSGSTTVAGLPGNLVAALMLMAGDLYKHRETTVEGTITNRAPMSTTVEALLCQYRYWRS